MDERTARLPVSAGENAWTYAEVDTLTAAEHDVLWQLVKDARKILQPCAETELASVFGM